ncbi:hypothetical protein HORIV_70080 [Vreelandella olivaria]|uniref:Large-conductance mechanosensitive channel n=1 Tax=Vreelandella olivaria TaxID=390919 RepID=A0ABM7GV10_9GAMM|nr:hypothetical protein HORIV_70080 [Halomonas olivaria]
MAKFFQEFREFAVKGNVVDMAVGIIIGGAFTLIVQSLVADVMNPLIGLLVGVWIFPTCLWCYAKGRWAALMRRWRMPRRQGR